MSTRGAGTGGVAPDGRGTRAPVAAPGSTELLARLGGAALLAASGAVHLDLYLTGYRHIPTVGPLFLAQFALAVSLATVVVATRLRSLAAAGAAFAAATVGGYVLSVWVGLFGFHEIRTTAGVVAGAFEVLAVGLLGACAVRAPSPGTLPPERLAALLPAARRALAPVTVAVAVALAVATANAPGSGPPATSATGTRPSGPGTRPAGPAGTAVVRVSIRDFAFVPARVVASPGEEVVVTNHDSVTHTFTATPGSRPFGRFDSGDISPGSTVTVRAPRSPGSYAFYCRIHPFMTGALVVR